MKVVIDTDPGTDDALALMMALNSPDLEVQGLTTVGGNATLAHTTRNALRVLEYMGRSDIPVFRGASRPLRGSFRYGYYFHGPAGLTTRLPLPRSEPKPLPASEYIARVAESLAGELVVIALGPLTNLANTLTREPRVNGWVREIVVMGGAVDVPGNITHHAEFNIYNDPRAADLVLSSGIPVTMVALDVSNHTYVDRTEDAWPSGDSISGRLATRILKGWFRSHPDSDRYDLCDPLAIVAAVKPSLLSYETAHVRVETETQDRLGKTSASYGDGRVRVATEVHALEAKELVRALLRKS